MNRILTLALAAAALGADGSAQEAKGANHPAAKLVKPPPTDRPASAELVRRRDEKLAAPWIRLAPWSTDFDAARAESERTGKPVFVYFTRSYAP